MKRIAILYSRLSGYTLACLGMLKNRYDVEILLIHWKSSVNAPFTFNGYNGVDHVYIKNNLQYGEMSAIIGKFTPDLVFIPGWMDKDYFKIARRLKKQGSIVVSGFDNQWKGNFKQYMAAAVAPAILKRSIDFLWVAGERQAYYARKLGFTDSQIWHGYYSCDWELFGSIYKFRKLRNPKSFLYAGRYVETKGVDTLLKAYQLYRERVINPWELKCVGTGPLDTRFNDREGLINIGFQQPSKLPNIMKDSTVFVMPSKYEPWGVVIHEAAASGMPILCSSACGASVHLVQDGYNGFIFGPNNAEQLSELFAKMTCINQNDYQLMSRRSHELSKQFTPERWADTLMNGTKNQKSGR